MANEPEKKFSAGAVTATVWENKSKKEGEESFKTVSLQRAYKDKKGDWQHTSNFGINDIPKAKLVLKKAYEYLVLKGQEE